MNTERDSRNEKKLDEFVLVKNDKTPIFRETDVTVTPIAIGKDGVEFEILDKDNKRIGFVKGDKTFEFDKEYEKELLNSMGKLYDFLGFDTEKLKFDVMKKVKEQEEKQQMQIEKVKNLNKVEENNKVSKNQHEDINNNIKDEQKQDYNNKISKEDFAKQGFNIVRETSIEDPQIIDSMIPSSNINPMSITVAQLEDGSFEFFARENVTGNIVKLNERAGGKTNSSEEVNIIENNEERTTNAGTTKIMPDFGNMEFSIKNNNGTLEVSVLDNIDERGNRAIIGVDTRTRKTTMEEYNRRKDEYYDEYGEPSSDSILTNEEMEERISKIRNPIVREMVQDRIEGNDNCTKEELENIIEDCDDEYSIENHEPQRGDRGMRH